MFIFFVSDSTLCLSTLAYESLNKGESRLQDVGYNYSNQRKPKGIGTGNR